MLSQTHPEMEIVERVPFCYYFHSLTGRTVSARVLSKRVVHPSSHLTDILLQAPGTSISRSYDPGRIWPDLYTSAQSRIPGICSEAKRY